MKLSIQTLFPTGNYLNKKYGIEMDFPDYSNPAENFKYLNEIVTSIHMAEFPSLYKDGKPLYSNYSGEEPTEVQVKDQPVSDEPKVEEKKTEPKVEKQYSSTNISST